MGILLSKQEQGLLNLLEELFSSHDWITFSELAKKSEYIRRRSTRKNSPVFSFLNYLFFHEGASLSNVSQALSIDPE